MKKISIGFAFILLISFQEVKATAIEDEANIRNKCDRLLAQCKTLSMNLDESKEDVAKDPACKKCIGVCEQAKAKDACYLETEKFKSVALHSLHCRKVCAKTSATKKD